MARPPGKGALDPVAAATARELAVLLGKLTEEWKGWMEAIQDSQGVDFEVDVIGGPAVVGALACVSGAAD